MASGITFERRVDQLPGDDILAEIDREVDLQHLESLLMEEGIRKFADPQKSLLATITQKRSELAAT